MNRRDFLIATGAAVAGVATQTQAQTPPSVPIVAQEAGYTNLIFQEEFDSFPDIGIGNGHTWTSGLWWVYPQPSLSCFSQHGSVLTITGGAASHVELCTQFHDGSGGTQFLNGYFEARIQAWDWSAFWLLCWDRYKVAGSAVDPNNPLTWTNEIDILETDPQYPNSAWQTLHQNSSGNGGVPDLLNQNVRSRKLTNALITGYWHTYGLLWTPSQLTWYIDNMPVQILAPYPSTQQPVQLVLTAGPGGVGGSTATSPGQTNPPTTKVDYVRVWR